MFLQTRLKGHFGATDFGRALVVLPGHVAIVHLHRVAVVEAHVEGWLAALLLVGGVGLQGRVFLHRLAARKQADQRDTAGGGASPWRE